MVHKGYYFILLFLCFSQLFAQNKTLPFIQYTIDDGLPSMHIYDIIQDSKGFIWLATDAGLSCFDGYTFKNYSTKDGLTFNDVFRLREDAQGRIWLTSFGELCYIENEKIHCLPTTDDNLYKGILQIHTTTNNGFWIGKRGRVFYMDSLFHLSQNELFVNHPKKEIFRLQFARNDTVWTYHDNHLYAKYHSQIIDTISLQFHQSKPALFCSAITGNSILYTNDKGLAKLNLETQEQSLIYPNLQRITRMAAVQNELWLSNVDKGIMRLDINQKPENINQETYLSHTTVGVLYEDREKNRWITTFGDGLYFIPANGEKRNNYSTEEGLAENIVSSVFIDENHNTWIGMQSGKLDCLKEDGSLEHYEIPRGRSNSLHRVLDMAIAPKSKNFLIVTDDGLFQKKEDQFEELRRLVLKSIATFPSGDILLTYYKGTLLTHEKHLSQLNNYRSIADFPKDILNPISDVRSYAAFQDSKENTWLGDVGGLKQVTNNAEIIEWKDKSNTFRALIRNIQETENGLIWIATHGEGVIVIQDSTYYQINKSKGLSSDLCTDLVIDGNDVWVTTNRGVNHIKSFDYASKQLKIEIIGLSDGLPTNGVNCIAKKGSKIVVGTNKGISIFDEKDLKKNTIAPQLHIKKIKINNQDTTLSSSYILPHAQNNIEIEFIGISYQSMKNIMYQYQMEGIDPTWKTTPLRIANYTTLPPGNYTFKVKAIANNGEESDKTASIYFKIQPHFSDTWWFQILIGGLIVGVLYYIYYSIVNYSQKKKLKLLVAEKTKALNQKVAEIAETNVLLENSNAALKQFAYIVSHDLKAPLRAISTLASFIEEDLEDHSNEDIKENLSLLKARIRRMSGLINGILEYSRVGRKAAEKDRVDVQQMLLEVIASTKDMTNKEVNIHLLSTFPILYINPTLIQQIFQNLLSNAIKYNDKTLCEIEIHCIEKTDCYQFSVKDNGPGIAEKYHDKIFQIFQTLQPRDKVESTGVGLSIVKKIVEEHAKGQIWLSSEAGKGTTFIFTIEKSLKYRKEQVAQMA